MEPFNHGIPNIGMMYRVDHALPQGPATRAAFQRCPMHLRNAPPKAPVALRKIFGIMARTITLVGTTLLLLAAQAQTITPADVTPVIGARYVYVIAEGKAKHSFILNEAGGIIDDLIVYRIAGSEPPPAGAGQTWSHAATPLSTATDTITVLDAAATPHGASFPTATYALHAAVSNAYTYYEVAATELKCLGGDPDLSNQPFVYNPTQRALPLPLALNGTWEWNFAGELIGTTGSGSANGTVSGVADATGTLTLPSGQVHQALRATRTVTGVWQLNLGMPMNIDLLMVQDLYFAAGIPVPVMESVRYGDDGFQTRFLVGQVNVGVEAHAAPAAVLTVFPSVTNDVITVTVEGRADVPVYSIVNAAGQLVRAERLDGLSGNGTRFSVRGLAKGVHVLRAQFKDGTSVTRRFVVI